MTRHQAAVRQKARGFSHVLAVFLLASAGMGLGCVDLTQPWKKSSPDAGAPGNTPDARDAGGPGESDGRGSVGADTADANWAFPDLPADRDQRPDQREEDAPAQTPGDVRGSEAAATSDTALPPVDGTVDLAADAWRPAADAAPAKEDAKPDIPFSLPDSGREDLPADTAPPPRDTGRDVLDIPGLVAYYPCESSNAAVLPDVSGHTVNATLAIGPPPTGGTGGTGGRADAGTGGAPPGFGFGPGKVGNALALSPSNNAYVSLPSGIVSQLREVTIATWVKNNSNRAFQRIFDFGMNTETFMYLATTNASGTAVRFRIVSAPLAKNQILDGAVAIPVGNWTHVALTLGDDGISISFDGVRIAYVSTANLRPSDLGRTVNNFIGRSNFTEDPYLDGQIDEFRIYDRVLSAAEIADLAGR
jgi:hypothetical protein